MVVTAIPLGIAIGLSLGLVGGGGSVLAVPALVYLLGESAHSATTTSLVVVAAAALAGGIVHTHVGRVCWRHAIALAVPATGAILAGTAANAAVGGNLLLGLFAPIMLVAALVTWRRAAAADGARATGACPPLRPGRDALAGAALGLLTGFFGVGGGFVVVPMLALALGFPLRSAIGTSLVIVCAVSLIALVAHLAAGNTLDPGITSALTASCVAGAVAGARLAPRFSRETLARGFAGVVAAVALYLIVSTTVLGGISA
jgi:uncharacterized protein